MMKTNLALSKLMKDACSSVRDSLGNAGQVLRAMGKALLNGQEVSVHHAAYVCIGLPLRGSSRDTIFVPSSPPADRTFLVKQDWESKCLPPESTDCLALSIVDKYALRKHNLHLRELGADDVCLADFACLYSPARKQSNAGDDADNDAAETADSDTEEPVPSGRLFEQKRYVKRHQERVLRYVHYKLHDDPEAYYQEQLLLYYPWEAEFADPFSLSVNEDACLLAGHTTFESRYEAVRHEIEHN
jgi:hypothetical protein